MKGFLNVDLTNAQQLALYECTKINTAYRNNIKLHFGNRLRMLLNKLFKREERLHSLDQRVKAEGSTEQAIKEPRRKEVFEPITRMKLSIAKNEVPVSDVLDEKALSCIRALLSTYPSSYKFEENSIYYDVKVHPENHFKAFYKIAELLETETANTFNCFPIRTSFISCYITLDTKIVHYHILKQKTAFKAERKFETWGDAVDLGKKAFKTQGPNKSLRFQGTIETDGVGVSVLKQNADTGIKQPKMKTKEKGADNEVGYIEDVKPAELKKNEGKYVLIDPGRHDILFCLKETSTVKQSQVLKYTKITRNKLGRHSKILRKNKMPEMVKEAELILSKTISSSVDVEKFRDYVKARASVIPILKEYYGNKTLNTTQTYFPGSCTEFSIRGRGNLYFGQLFVTRIRGYYPQKKKKGFS